FITLVTGGAMLAAVAVGLAPLVIAIMVACGVLVASGALPFRRALESLDLDVLIIVASAIAVGTAMEQSGVAAMVASSVVRIHAWVAAPMLVVAVLVVATIVLTELITNVAAAALMVPVALDVALQTGMDPTGLAVTVAIGASASFLTPIGYQTNTIVYGLGGYRFGDYWRLGLPLSVLTVASTSVIIPLLW
ncbi:MAG: SLC13 family permease, partial [Nitriliruptoraceae bacterium]